MEKELGACPKCGQAMKIEMERIIFDRVITVFVCECGYSEIERRNVETEKEEGANK